MNDKSARFSDMAAKMEAFLICSKRAVDVRTYAENTGNSYYSFQSDRDSTGECEVLQ